jgi:hypothetical protein
MAAPNLLFVDTNIWLDFYRARNETGLQLLGHTEALIDKIVVNYQLESEFKKNRQAAILEGMQELKAPPSIPRLGIFADAKVTKLMHRSSKDVEKRARTLRFRLRNALENPVRNDPVYQACQRVFHKQDDLSLRRDDQRRFLIRRRAFKRFLHGMPPRKKSDTSIGDAFNWEWMVHCASARNANLVIVSRDADYGVALDGKSYINDYLKQEFAERVGRNRRVLLHSRLSDALKLFAVEVSPQEVQTEAELVEKGAQRTGSEFFSTSNRALFLKYIDSLLGTASKSPGMTSHIVNAIDAKVTEQEDT